MLRSCLKRLIVLAAFCVHAGDPAFAYTVKSYEGRFSIEFPTAPQLRHSRGIGTCWKDVYEFRASEGQRVWSAVYQDCLPHGYLEDTGHGPFLRDNWKEITAKVKGELRANDPIEQGNLSGREYLILVPLGDQRIIRVRTFIDGDRVYKLMYIGPLFTEESSDVESFFQSFRLMR
jgi:hypothetical protein